MTDITVTVPVKVSTKRIADLMCSCMEGNDMAAAWCNGIELISPVGYRRGKGNWYYDYPELYVNRHLKIEVSEFDETGEKKDKKRIITAKHIAAGLKLMAEKHGSHFGDFMNENEDAITADVFLQCVVLKDVVYG